MYNCYNEAFNYLKNKYDTTFLGSINRENVVDSDDKEILLLLNQYSLGIAAKKELYYLLIKKNIIKE